jgi:hypothetical protein
VTTTAKPAARQQTYNADVLGLTRRINRFIVEIALSQSSGVSLTTKDDVARSLSYVKAVREYLKWVISQPTLDLPKTSPSVIDLPASPVIPDMENESMFDICSLLARAREELVLSQSSRLSSNLLPVDVLRLTAVLDKVSNFIATYVTVVDPLDLPESSPMAAVTGLGRQGV